MHAKLLIDDPFRDPNIYWASGFLAPDPFVYVETPAEKYVLVNELEYGRAQKQVKPGVTVELANTYGKLTEPFYLNAVIGFLKKHGITEITVPDTFPAVYFYRIRISGVRVNLGKQIFPERAVKTDNEIQEIEKVQRTIEEVFELALKRLADATIKNGLVWEGNASLTSDELRMFMDLEFYRRGYANPLGIIIASGKQAVDPHSLGTGPLEANVPIVFDIFPRSRFTLYWSDMTRTVVKGRLKPKARRMYKTVKEAQELGINLVRDGVSGKQIHEAIEQFFEKHRYATSRTAENVSGFIHGTGHGVGLEIHEAPRISRLSTATDVLREGNVITIEPGLYYPEIGGVRIEDTLVVTKTGSRNLARAPKDLLEL